MATGLIIFQDISPWYVGQLSPLWNLSLTADGVPVSLVGASTVTIIFVRANEPPTAGAGVATITDAANGNITYQLAAADVTTYGQYNVYVEVAMPNGLLISDPVPWTLSPLS